MSQTLHELVDIWESVKARCFVVVVSPCQGPVVNGRRLERFEVGSANEAVHDVPSTILPRATNGRGNW